MSTSENNITTTAGAAAATTIPFHNNTTHKRRAKTPSFSSILLDAIYRSIDDTYTDTDSSSSQHNHTPKTATTTTSISNSIDYDQVYNDGHNDYVQSSKHRRTKMRSHSHLETMELRHAIMIDSLIEKQPPLTPPQQPKQQQQQQQQQAAYYNNNRGCYSKISSNADDNTKFNRQKSVPSRSNNTASSSSTSSTLSCFTQPKNRTDITPKREMSSRIFNKTKLKALKIYGDLKKSKQHQHQHHHHQPISPGARIAAFLNSIFRNSAGATPRRPPINRSPAAACSSTSCLTVKPKRSAKYTHIPDEYDHKNLIVTTKSTYDDQKQQQQQQRKWKREKEIDTLMMTMKRNRSNNDYRYKEVLKIEMNSDEEMMNVEEDEDEDDGESCASSSDLFELENFSSIGVTRFNQELPVYGTTCLKNLI